MDLGSPAVLFAGLVLSTIGAGFFIYGKKQASPKHLCTGVALCGVPFVVHSAVVLWCLGGAIIGGLWASNRV